MSDYVVPSMEFALLQLFTRGGRNNHQLPARLAEAIFQKDPLETRVRLTAAGFFAEGRTVGRFVNMVTEYREARLKADSERRRAKSKEGRKQQLESGVISNARMDRIMANDELDIRERERQKRAAVAFPVAWVPSALPPEDAPASEHSYWLTCFARVCFANLMLELTPRDSRLDSTIREKASLWLNAHIPMLRYLDSGIQGKPEGEPYTDLDVDPVVFGDSYTGVRNADYPADHALIRHRTQMVPNPNRPLPDMLLCDIDFELPDLLEQAEEVYRQVHDDPHSDIVQWLVIGTNQEIGLGDRTAQQDAQHNRYPFFRCKKFVDADDILNHCIWSSALLSLRTLGDVRARGDVADKYKDAAYLWQLAFLDLADACERAGRYDDVFLLTPDPRAEVSILEAFYPWPGRAFHDGDLPNLFSTLSVIAMRGEQHVPKYNIARVINKSLAFACMRRLLTDTTRTALKEELSFFKVFSKMMQCMLMGTYAGSNKRLEGDSALAAMRLCSSREALIAKLAIAEDQSCRIILTAVRAYLAEYGRLNSAYSNASDKVIYWHGFVRDTHRMAEIVRETNLCAIDTFAEARVRLERHRKSSDAIVYRYRDSCVSESLFKTVSKQLEENTFREMEDARRDIVVFQSLIQELEENGRTLAECRDLWNAALLTDHSAVLEQLEFQDDALKIAAVLRHLVAINTDSIQRYAVEVPKEIKQHIINTMLHVPENMRFTEPCFSQLCEPEFGGLRRAVVHSLVRLVELYHERGAPKESQEQLADFSPYELKVVTWFLHICRLYDRVHLVRLDPTTEKTIETSMLTRRAVLYPGIQSLVPNDFMVYVTICCERVITKRDGAYGHDDVRYDLDLETPVCKRGNKTTKRAADDHKPLNYLLPATSDSEVAERASAHKLAFLRISCPKPVLCINLRGYKLVTGSHRGTKRQYMHCPKCASFHRVKTTGYLTKGGYACQRCLANDKTIQRIYKCGYCNTDIEPRFNKKEERWEEPTTTVRVMRFVSDPADPEYDVTIDPTQMWQELYFCNAHYGAAVAISHQRPADQHKGKPFRYLEKADLFHRIGQSALRNAERSQNIKFASRGVAKDN